MKLYYFRTSIYTTLSDALRDNAVVEYSLDDVPAAAVAKVAVLTADLLAGDSEPLRFVVTTNDGRVLDQLEAADLAESSEGAAPCTD